MKFSKASVAILCITLLETIALLQGVNRASLAGALVVSVLISVYFTGKAKSKTPES